MNDRAVRLELSDLLVEYASAVDERDWNRFESLFAPDAPIDYEKALGPRLPVGPMRHWLAEHLTTDRLLACQHLLANVRIDVEGTTGRGRAGYVNADVVRDQGDARLLLNGGAYEATFSVIAGAWRIAALDARLLWSIAADPASTSFPFLSNLASPLPSPGEPT